MDGDRTRDKPVTAWIDYWDQENTFDRCFDWQGFANVFVEASEPILHYTTEDVVLDIGSHNLDAEIIHTQLTTSPARKHVLITF